MTNSLAWNKHVENVAANGKMTLGECTKQVNAASYTTFVHPALECASTVWDPHSVPGTNPGEGCQVRDE